MRISTLSIMVGSSTCNLRCKYCISRTTYNIHEKDKLFVPSEDLVEKAARVFTQSEGFTALITGKGEPTLIPHQKLVNLIHTLYKFTPVIELQTNGIFLTNGIVKDYTKAGLSAVAISCASSDDKFNFQMMANGCGKPWNLAEKIKLVIKNSLVLRLTLVAGRGGVDSVPSFLKFIHWLKFLAPQNYPLQITIRQMGLPLRYQLKTRRGKEVAKFVRVNMIDTKPIWEYLKKHGQKIITFPWGSEVFDFEGISVCIAECLTIRPQDDTIRSAILYPDGHLRYSWEFPGAVIF